MEGVSTRERQQLDENQREKYNFDWDEGWPLRAIFYFIFKIINPSFFFFFFWSIRAMKRFLQLRYPETKTRSGTQWSLCCWALLTSGFSLWPSASLWKNNLRSVKLHTHKCPVIWFCERTQWYLVSNLFIQVLGSEGTEEAILQTKLVPCTSIGLYDTHTHAHCE